MQLFADQGINLSALQMLQIVYEHNISSGTFWLDDIYIGPPGDPAVDQRVVHLADDSQKQLALHVPDGSSWQITSDVPWLEARAVATAGPTTLIIETKDDVPLQPGYYMGRLTLSRVASMAQGTIEGTVQGASVDIPTAQEDIILDNIDLSELALDEVITVYVTISDPSEGLVNQIFLPIIKN